MSKNPQKPMKKKPNKKLIALAKLAALVGKPARETQRTRILGALKYDRKRTHADSIFQILAECLTKGVGVAVSGDVVRKFFADAHVSSDDFFDACLTDWRLQPEVADYVLDLLKRSGYEGHIDDLWLSVYGKVKPSPPPQAFVARDPKTGKILAKRPWWVKQSRTIHTGQTRKPGSHNS
jgi:hypothetical protein